MTDKRRVFIVHEWGGTPESGWCPWLKERLEERGFSVSVPEMPDTDEPEIEKWVSFLSQRVGDPDENTFFVGHSVGCQTILRYLESVSPRRVGGAVFVAGWFYLDNLEEDEKPIARPWLEGEIDFGKVLESADSFTVLLSSDDHYNKVKENKRMFEESLGARVVVLDGMGHFTEGDGVTELPAVLEELDKMSQSM